jgi:hypothetical protein
MASSSELLIKIQMLASVRGNLLLHNTYANNRSLLVAVKGVLIPEVSRAIQEHRLPMLPYIQDIIASPEEFPEEAELISAAQFSIMETNPLPGYKSCCIRTSQLDGSLIHFSLQTDCGAMALDV